jgi:hypothetical protein
MSVRIPCQSYQSAVRCTSLILIMLVAILGSTALQGSPEKPTPWTHQAYPDSASDFHFAVVGDRAANPRLGVFKAALAKVQLLRPDLVLSVGDFIHGYAPGMKPLTDKAVIGDKRNAVDEMLKSLAMPFYRVAGNHDINNDVSAGIWKQRYGPDYYAFVYRNVLFMCLNSQDGKNYKAGIGATQLTWAKQTLAKHSAVRWTCLFFHQPLWLEDANRIKKAKAGNNTAQLTGFDQIETLLKGRDYTVFAGHHHQYGKWIKNGNTYLRLATTGGASALTGLKTGRFDHVMWITMTDKGPVVCNLLLEGILDEDAKCTLPQVVTEKK